MVHKGSVKRFLLYLTKGDLDPFPQTIVSCDQSTISDLLQLPIAAKNNADTMTEVVLKAIPRQLTSAIKPTTTTAWPGQ